MRQYERGVVFRLGRIREVREPGTLNEAVKTILDLPRMGR